MLNKTLEGEQQPFVRSMSGCVKRQEGSGPKSETRNPKQIQMVDGENPKRYDLEERTFQFASKVRRFVRLLTKQERMSFLILILDLFRISGFEF